MKDTGFEICQPISPIPYTWGTPWRVHQQGGTEWADAGGGKDRVNFLYSYSPKWAESPILYRRLRRCGGGLEHI